MTKLRSSAAGLALATLAAAGCSGDGPTPPQTPPGPANVVVVSAPGAGDTIGAVLPGLLVVEVRDSSGALLPAASVTFRADGAGTAQLAAQGSDAFQDVLSLQTGTDGRASARVRLGSVAGTDSLRAVAGLATAAQGVTIHPGAPVTLAVSPQDTMVFGPYELSAVSRDRAGNEAGRATARTKSAEVQVTPGRLTSFTVSAPRGGWHEVLVRIGELSATARFLAVPAGASAVAVDRTPTGPRLVLFNLDGSAYRGLTEPFATVFMSMTPTWAPDGRSIVFDAEESRNYPSDLLRVDLEGSIQRLNIGDGGFTGDPSWPMFSPDGKSIYFSMWEHDFSVMLAGAIWRAGANGEQPTRVNERFDFREYSHPSFSPDGTRMVYSLTFYNWDQGPFLAFNTPGRSETEINGTAPRWSPRGDLIAYLDQNVLMGISPDSSTGRVLVQGRKFEEAPSWSPDGEWLIARTVEPGRLMVIHVATGKAMHLPFDTSRLWEPAWKP